jgi:hypothetical protein
LNKFEDDSYVEILLNGLNKVHLIEIDNENQNVTEFTLSDITFWYLSSIFIPKELVSNHPDLCGTWIIPYEVLESMLRFNWDLPDNFGVAVFEIHFRIILIQKIQICAIIILI